MSILIYQPQINKAIDKKNIRLWGWRQECLIFLYDIRVMGALTDLCKIEWVSMAHSSQG